MIRHSQQQPEEAWVYYAYHLFSSCPQVACFTSTRLSGVSQDHLRSLNLSFRVGDEEEKVLVNKDRFYRLLDVDAETVAQAQLVHGSPVEVVREYAPRDARYKFPSTDGLATNLIDRPLFIPVADCLAIAYVDPKHHAIGLANAGWKGAIARMPQEMVKIMHATYGTDPADLLVGVSPGLGPCCYEVQQDLVAIFTETFPQDADFSPIEEAFSKLKAVLRRVGARTPDALQEAIGQALLTITPQDALGWFTHCGYRSVLDASSPGEKS